MSDITTLHDNVDASPRRKIAPSPYGRLTSRQTGDEWPLVFPFRDGYFNFSPNPPEWIIPILEDICKLDLLPQNWDSYGAVPIGPETALKAMILVINLLSPNDPTPLIVPTRNGGIQLEWHDGGIDLEVELVSPTRTDMLFEDDEREEEVESVGLGAIKEKLTILRERLK